MEALTNSRCVEQCFSTWVLSLFVLCTRESKRVMQHTLVPLFSHSSAEQQFVGVMHKEAQKSVKGREGEDCKLVNNVNIAGFKIFKNVSRGRKSAWLLEQQFIILRKTECELFSLFTRKFHRTPLTWEGYYMSACLKGCVKLPP